MKNPVTRDMNQTAHRHFKEETKPLSLSHTHTHYMDMKIRYIILFFFNPDQLLCGAPNLLLKWQWGFSPVVKSPGLIFITQLHLVPRSISLLALYTFMAWAGTTLFFPFAMRDATSGSFVNYLIILLLKSNANTQVSRWVSFGRD